MGQRSRYHLALVKEEKRDEMVGRKGRHWADPFPGKQPSTQDLLPLGIREKGTQKSSSPRALHLPGVLEVSTEAPQGSAPVLGGLWWGEFCAQESVVGGPAGSTGVRPQGSEEESIGGKFQGWLWDRMLLEGTGDQGSAEGPQDEPLGSVLGLRPEMGTAEM